MEKDIQEKDKKKMYESLDYQWHSLHKIAGFSAFLIAILLLGEIFVYALIPRPTTPMECIELFQKNPLFGLLHFDLLGMLSYILFIPMIISLYMILKQKSASLMLIASVLFFVGIAVFFATNTTFSLLSLSKQYSLAETEAERVMIITSCQTMITIFKVQAFMLSYIIVSASWIMIGIVMLSCNLFSRFTSYMGILTGSAGILAEIIENTSNTFIGIAIGLYFAAIVFLLLWILLTGKQLLNIGTYSRNKHNMTI
jgi:hypothetical protein